MRQRAILIVVGILGYAGLYLLFPRIDWAARIDFEVDRKEAISKAREAARLFGIDAQGWTPSVSTSRNTQTIYYLNRPERGKAATYGGPLTSRVRLQHPQDESWFEAEFFPDGRLRRIRRSTKGLPEETKVEDAQQACREALRLIAGQESDRFEPTNELPSPESEPQQGKVQVSFTTSSQKPAPEAPRKRVTLNYEAIELSDPLATPQARCVVHGTTVTEAGLSIKPSDAFDDDDDARERGVDLARGIGLFLILVAVLAGLVFYLVVSLNREVRHRNTLAGVLLVLAVQAVGYFFGGGAEGQWLSGGLGDAIASFFAFQLLVITPFVVGFLLAGIALTTLPGPRRTISIDLLLEGRFRARPVGESLFAGLMLGGLLAAIPYALTATGLFADAQTVILDPQPWTAQVPALSAFDLRSRGPLLGLLFLFAFGSSVLTRYNAKPLLARTILYAVGIPILSIWAFEASLPAALLSGALAMIVAEQVYRRYDLLAVLAMGFAVTAVLKAQAMIAQPAPIDGGGYGIYMILAAACGVSLLVAVKGRPLDIDQEASHRQRVAEQGAMQRGAERDKLIAEFSVARKAQQLMLPESAPEIPGFDVAGACNPAKEVGGDLYDYLPLDGGKWGIVVADVSGKGVPAALYMTLTKGLLSSVIDSYQEPDDIVKEINGHLFEAGRRRVFVTLALGVLDPATAVARCARAGHNPLLRKEAATDRVEFINSPGIGLGLTSGRLFDRSLSVKDVELQPGDTLIFYSDGITEAMNASGEEYGEDRFAGLVSETNGLGAHQLRDAILADVSEFVGDTPPSDDITLVVLKRRPERAEVQV